MDPVTPPFLASRLPEIVRPKLPPWPIWVCAGAYSLLTVILVYVCESGMIGWPARSLYENVMVSLILGELALATIIGGLALRTWISSWLLAVLLTIAVTVVTCALVEGVDLVNKYGWRRLSICVLWPAMLLGTSTPLFVLRSLCGWTLTRRDNPAIARWPLSLEDIVQFGVIVACTLTFTQAFLVAEGPGNVWQLLAIMSAFAICSLVCITPVVYATFRSRTWSQRLSYWFLLSALAFATTFVTAIFLNPNGTLAGAVNSLSDMAIGVPVTCLTVAIGLTSFLLSGYRLTYFDARLTEKSFAAQKVTAGAVPLVNESGALNEENGSTWLKDGDDVPVKKRFELNDKWQSRIATGIVVILAMICGFGLQMAKKKEMQRFEDMARDDLRQTFTRDQEVVGLQFNSGFSDADLASYMKYANSITHLSFAGTQITDAMLPRLAAFPNLTELDLSRTAITDANLSTLKLSAPIEQSRRGSVLSLSDTQVTWQGARDVASRMPHELLELAGLNITDEQLSTGIAAKGLSLARNPITDAGVDALLEHSNIHRLDLSDTSITGKTLDRRNCPTVLILDGTNIDDANLTKLLTNRTVDYLSIQNTQVTAAVLPLLVGKSVKLGAGPITESDLLVMGNASFSHLGLHDKKFDGRCLLAGKIKAMSVDLSGSSVTDDIVMQFLTSGSGTSYLGLANTRITDACLTFINTAELDIRGTSITVRGLSARPQRGRLVISHQQFTPLELANLQRIGYQLDERSEYCLFPR